jgi:hypothetical protein
LLAGKSVLIDCAPKLGCVCSGATPGVPPTEARSQVVALEPPRAPRPVIDEQIIIDATLPLPASPRSAIDVVSPPAVSTARYDDVSPAHDRIRAPRTEEVVAQPPTVAPTEALHVPTPPRRPSPGRGIARPSAGTLPTARDAGGRQLPRTYVAHRRLPSRTPRSVPIADVVTPPATPRADAASAAPAVGDAAARTRAPEMTSAPPPAAGTPTVISQSVSEPAIAPRPQPATLPKDATEPTRYAERTVSLPVTKRSDTAPRQEPAPQIVSERPLMQLITLGLLISMIVLVSAAVGVLVGRWMTQH